MVTTHVIGMNALNDNHCHGLVVEVSPVAGSHAVSRRATSCLKSTRLRCQNC